MGAVPFCRESDPGKKPDLAAVFMIEVILLEIFRQLPLRLEVLAIFQMVIHILGQMERRIEITVAPFIRSSQFPHISQNIAVVLSASILVIGFQSLYLLLGEVVIDDEIKIAQ